MSYKPMISIKKSFFTIITLLIIYIFIYNSNNQPLITNNKLQRYHFLSFGTTIQITTNSTEPKLSDQNIKTIEDLLNKLHYKWHPWRDGDLKNLNNSLASLKWFEVSPEELEVIKIAKKFYNTSGGYFNPAIGKLINYWGFHTDNPNDKNNNIIDPNFEINAYIKRLPSPNNITISPNSPYIIKNNNPNLQLDVSGFIKAKAMLAIKNILKANKINNAIVNIGGDIYTIGNKNLNTPWSIAIQNNNDNNNFKVILYDGESIATSGVYARYKDQKDSKLIHHIINPKTGKSADGFYSVTIIDKDPYKADAAATAILIAGYNDYLNVIKSMKIDKYLLIDQSNQVIVSKAMQSRYDRPQQPHS